MVLIFNEEDAGINSYEELPSFNGCNDLLYTFGGDSLAGEDNGDGILS